MTLYVVGRLSVALEDGETPTWDLQGVFDNLAAAIDACRDSDYFIGPVLLNQSIAHESEEWPGLMFPLRRTQ